jgi:peptide/nickel transport system permease protein
MNRDQDNDRPEDSEEASPSELPEETGPAQDPPEVLWSEPPEELPEETDPAQDPPEVPWVEPSEELPDETGPAQDPPEVPWTEHETGPDLPQEPAEEPPPEPEERFHPQERQDTPIEHEVPFPEPQDAPRPDTPRAPSGKLLFSQDESERPGQSYWQIVSSQFQKNPMAVWSKRILFVMFLLAVYAPVFSFNVPFYFVDEMRTTLSDGNLVEVGPYRFTIIKKTKEEPSEDEDGNSIKVKRTIFLLREGREETQILGKVKIGSKEGCKICRADLAAVEACFGMWRGEPWVEDLSGTVKVNSKTPSQTTFPWLIALFDRNEFETEIDIVFNMLIFYLPPAFLLLFIIGRLVGPKHRSRARFAAMVVLFIGIAAIFAFYKAGHETRLPMREYEEEIKKNPKKRTGLFPFIAKHSYQQELTSVRLKHPFASAFFGKTDDTFKTSAKKDDHIFVGEKEFTISLMQSDERKKSGKPARLFLCAMASDESTLLKGTIFLGKGKDCDIRLSGPDIAQRHAAVTLDPDGQIWVKDLAQDGAVRVNDVPTNGVLESVFGKGYVFGTDGLGRNVFTRLLYGTRISLTIGIVAVSIYVFIGIIIGGIAGYFGGVVDILLSRLIEIMMCFPSFFLILTLVAVLGQSIFYVMLIIGVTRWTGVARLVRGEFLKQRQIDYVTAARALGVSRLKIMFKHILPNAIAPVLVAASFGVAGAILVETGLSFLGLGDIRTPSWGQILQAGRETGAHHLIHVPGIAILITVAIMNLMGEGLRDALDPKLRK